MKHFFPRMDIFIISFSPYFLFSFVTRSSEFCFENVVSVCVTSSLRRIIPKNSHVLFFPYYFIEKNVTTSRSRRIDSEINFVLEREGWFGSNVEGKIYEEQAFSQLKHTASPPLLVFFSIFSVFSLSLSFTLSSLSRRRKEKSSAAGNSFLPAAASRELISVLGRREFFQVLESFFLSFPSSFFSLSSYHGLSFFPH